MEKKKEHTKRRICVIVPFAMALTAIVASACINEYIYYQGHFKIDKVRMTRIVIEDFPADNSVLYLMEVAYTHAPLDSMKYDGKLRMREIFPRSIDSIIGVTFRDMGLLAHPKQLHWNVNKKTNVIDGRHSRGYSWTGNNDSLTSFLYNDVDTFNAYMYLQEIKTKTTIKATYLTDYRNLPNYLKGMDIEAGKCIFDNTYPCSGRYLVSFDVKSSLPDEAYIQIKDKKKISVEIDNNPQFFRFTRKIYHYQPRN